MQTRAALVAVILLLAVGPALAGNLPDSQKTPGAALTKVPDAKAAKYISQKMGTTNTRSVTPYLSPSSAPQVIRNASGPCRPRQKMRFTRATV